MKKSETGFITRIVTLIMVCVMALSLIPNVSANATTTSKSTAYKSTKTMTCYLAGRERKTITMPADIAKISFGSQSAVKMRKASSRKVVVSGIRNGKTKFTVITKDKRRIVCNVVRTTKFTMGPSKKRVINTNIKLKYVKSSNKKLATVKLAKNKKSFTVTTKKKGTVKITVRYSNNKVETLRLVVAHQHTWVDHTATKQVPRTVHHDAVYETVTIPAVTKHQIQCLTCGQWFDSLDELTGHQLYDTNGACSGYDGHCERDVVITPAHTEQKLVKEAYDETVYDTQTYVDYQECTGCHEHRQK